MPGETWTHWLVEEERYKTYKRRTCFYAPCTTQLVLFLPPSTSSTFFRLLSLPTSQRTAAGMRYFTTIIFLIASVASAAPSSEVSTLAIGKANEYTEADWYVYI
jgi:hypothetical protein